MLTTNTDPNLGPKKNPKVKLPTVVDTQDTTFTTTTEQTNSDDEMLEIALVMEKERMMQEQEDNDFLEAALLLESTNLSSRKPSHTRMIIPASGNQGTQRETGSCRGDEQADQHQGRAGKVDQVRDRV